MGHIKNKENYICNMFMLAQFMQRAKIVTRYKLSIIKECINQNKYKQYIDLAKKYPIFLN